MVDRSLVNCDFPLLFLGRIVLLVFVNSELPITQVTQPVIVILVAVISVALRPNAILIVMIIVVVVVATASIIKVIIVVTAAVVAIVLVPAVLVRVTFVRRPAASTGTHRRRIKLRKVRIGMPTHGKTVEALHIERLARVVAVLRPAASEVRGLLRILLVIRLCVVIVL